MIWRATCFLTVTAGLLLTPTWSAGDKSVPQSFAQSTYVLRTSVMGGAGAPTQAGGFRQNGTLAQPTSVGVSTGSGYTLYAGFLRAWVEGAVVGISDETVSAFTHQLHQNHPNPFSPMTSIAYTVSSAGPVELTIYNIGGQRVRQLVSERKPAGTHLVTWDGASDQGTKVAQGIYFYRLHIGNFTEVKKMVVLK